MFENEQKKKKRFLHLQLLSDIMHSNLSTKASSSIFRFVDTHNPQSSGVNFASWET